MPSRMRDTGGRTRVILDFQMRFPPLIIAIKSQKMIHDPTDISSTKFIFQKCSIFIRKAVIKEKGPRGEGVALETR